MPESRRRLPREDVEVTAIFGAQSKRGLVEIRFGEHASQLTPAKAREIAAFLLEAAGAAEGDEALMAVLERIETPTPLIGQVLMALRIERGKIDERSREAARRATVEDQFNPDAAQ